MKASLLVLTKMFVPWYAVTGLKVFGTHDEVLRSIVFRTDLQHESSRGRIAPYSRLTLVFLQQKCFWTGFPSDSRPRLS